MNNLRIKFNINELPELRFVLDRAMNTLEPEKWPSWLGLLSDRVDRMLEQRNLYEESTFNGHVFNDPPPFNYWPSPPEIRSEFARYMIDGQTKGKPFVIVKP